MASRASTPRRLLGGAERKVHREFRTSRRALNVLSVRAGLSEQGTLYASARTDVSVMNSQLVAI